MSDDAYYAEPVAWAVENNITKGTTDSTFSPDNGCTRAQAVTFLWRAAGQPDATKTSDFSDVAKDEYYTKAVSWAVEKEITKGIGDGKFDPNSTCTRAQIVTFLWRYNSTPSAEDTGSFGDVKNDAYYAGAVSWAVEKEITKGTSNTTFGPDQTCTRTQIVTLLYRMDQAIRSFSGSLHNRQKKATVTAAVCKPVSFPERCNMVSHCCIQAQTGQSVPEQS